MHLPGVDFQPMVDAQSQLLLEHSDLLRDTRQRSEPSPSVRSVAALQRTVERLSDDLLQLETLVDSDIHSPEKSPTDSVPPPAQLYVPPSPEDSLSDENEEYPPPAEDATGIFTANGYCQPSGFSTPVPTAVYPDPPSPTPTAPDAPVQVRERAPSPPNEADALLVSVSAQPVATLSILVQAHLKDPQALSWTFTPVGGSWQCAVELDLRAFGSQLCLNHTGAPSSSKKIAKTSAASLMIPLFRAYLLEMPPPPLVCRGCCEVLCPADAVTFTDCHPTALLSSFESSVVKLQCHHEPRLIFTNSLSETEFSIGRLLCLECDIVIGNVQRIMPAGCPDPGCASPVWINGVVRYPDLFVLFAKTGVGNKPIPPKTLTNQPVPAPAAPATIFGGDDEVPSEAVHGPDGDDDVDDDAPVPTPNPLPASTVAAEAGPEEPVKTVVARQPSATTPTGDTRADLNAHLSSGRSLATSGGAVAHSDGCRAHNRVAATDAFFERSFSLPPSSLNLRVHAVPGPTTPLRLSHAEVRVSGRGTFKHRLLLKSLGFKPKWTQRGASTSKYGGFWTQFVSVERATHIVHHLRKAHNPVALTIGARRFLDLPPSLLRWFLSE